MNKTKRIYRMYIKFAYRNVINELISEVLQMENYKEYEAEHDTFSDGWHTAFDRVIDLLEKSK